MTESFKHHAGVFGFDPSFGTPVELPALAVGHIVTAAEPMQFAAPYIDAVSFMKDLGSEPKI